jgi:hypothetical protein
LLLTYQKIWKELCVTSECRTKILKSILQYRLTGTAGEKLNSVSPWLKDFESAWQKHWPNGLAIMSADIPNRDPFKDTASGSVDVTSSLPGKLKAFSDLVAQSRIPAEFEPLLPRKAGEVWPNSGLGPNQTNRLIRGLANEFSQSDIRKIDKWLSVNISEPALTLNSNCKTEEIQNFISIECKSNEANGFDLSLYLNKDGSEAPVNYFAVKRTASESETAGSLTANAMRAGNEIIISVKAAGGISYRTEAGLLASEIKINPTSGTAHIKLYNQLPQIDALVERALPAITRNIFSRYEIMKVLLPVIDPGNKMAEIDRPGLAVNVKPGEVTGFSDQPGQGLAVIKTNCSECHRNSENAPPNFLGSPSDNLSEDEICRRVEVCAPRMIYRLKMRLCKDSDTGNKKNPMPPEFYLNRHNISHDLWIQNYNPKILAYLNQLTTQSELARDILSTGVTQSEANDLAKDVLSDECPGSSSILYEHLPKCQFDDLKSSTHCR